jgi:predicted alpha-1,2-mannosidase
MISRPRAPHARRRRPAALLLAAALFAPLLPATAAEAVPPVVADPANPAALVDPMIGTLGSGFEFPGPQAPFGMVQLSPDTEGYFAYTGYQYADQFIRGFSHVHVQAMGVPEGGNVPFMPITGPLLSTDVSRYQVPFSHANEHAEAGYYRVKMANGVKAELTAGTRVGMHRYTFPPTGRGHLLLDIGRHVPGGADQPPFSTPGAYPATVRQVDARTVIGSANHTLTNPDRYAVHFAARFDRPIESFGVWSTRGGPVTWGATSVEGVGAGAALRFDAKADSDVVVKVGISFVDQAGALANLDAELPGEDFGFDALRARTRAAWNQELGRIAVTGGTIADQKVFYTALYHALQHPNVFSDVDGRYLGYDGLAHTIGAPGDPMPAGSLHYANFSFWDTYRGQVQLLMLVAPERFRDMVSSLDAIRKWGGRMPRWGLMNTYADFMNGEPALQVFADAYCRGLVPATALDSLYADAVGLALDPNRHRDPSYLQYGYIPMDISGSGASGTLEHALGDFALALVADKLGHTADRDQLLARAQSWRNQVDPQTGFVRPRKKDGTWMPNYHPELPDGFREGTGWQYSWLVPHDVAGLFDAMGDAVNGQKTVEQRLDRFFLNPVTALAGAITPELQQKITAFGIFYYGNQYAPSNEHDLQAPYLYDWTSTPWKTQGLARAYQGLYRPTPDGIPGNDDLGTMSSWYVWSALGFYPTVAGAPVYTIGSPVFPEARIRVGSGGFTVRAPNASLVSKFVNGGSLNGAPLTRTWLTHSALTPGGELFLRMNPLPTSTWGTEVDARPPSQSTSPLSAWGCAP